MLTSDQKGSIAEAAIALRALELGIGVFRPVGDGGRYDMIFDLGTDLLRVQCKWATRKGAVIVVHCRRCRRTSEGLLHRGYEAHEIDGVAAYCADIERSFFLPVNLLAGRKAILLRLAATRNNQALHVNWADDYSFESLQSKGPLGP